MAVMPLILIFGFLMLAGLLGLAFTVLSCVWLYRDSRLHGQPPALWVLLAVFAGPIIALLLYFIFGRRQALEPCESCGAPLTRADRFCSACGAVNQLLSPRARRWVCPVCGAEHSRSVNAAVNIKARGLAQYQAAETVS